MNATVIMPRLQGDSMQDVVTHLSYNITWVAVARILAVMIANAHYEETLTPQVVHMYSLS